MENGNGESMLGVNFKKKMENQYSKPLNKLNKHPQDDYSHSQKDVGVLHFILTFSGCDLNYSNQRYTPDLFDGNSILWQQSSFN